jgi:SNF2 family DNA or RNA helicase
LAENKTLYEKRYCGAKPGRFTKWDVTGATNLQELHEKLGTKMIRRTKKECLDLPTKTRMYEHAEFSPEAKRIFDQKLALLLEEYSERKRLRDLERIKNGEDPVEGGVNIMSSLGALRLAASIGKVETATEIASSVVEEGRQVVVFTGYIESAERIAEAISYLGIETELLTGDTDASFKDYARKGRDGKIVMANESERGAKVRRFQSGESKAFVATGGAGGVGLDLFAADMVILVDRPWTPGDAFQQEDRLHRIGQTKNVTALWLQYGTIDERVDEVLVKKQKYIDLVLEGKETTEFTESVSEVLSDWLLEQTKGQGE